MTDKEYVLFTSGPIDHWDDFIHIKLLSKRVERYLRDEPYSDLTMSNVWYSVLHKIHWMFVISKADKHLRSPDIYIYFRQDLNFPVLYKADNNGLVHLIMDDSFDVNDQVKYIPHEQKDEWNRS